MVNRKNKIIPDVVRNTRAKNLSPSSTNDACIPSHCRDALLGRLFGHLEVSHSYSSTNRQSRAGGSLIVTHKIPACAGMTETTAGMTKSCMRMTYKRAFTMLEVIVAIVIMSLMLTGMMNMVYYGMKTWQYGQGKLNAAAYNRMTYELIKQSMLSATSIGLAVGNIDTKLEFAAHVTNKYGTNNEVKFRIATGSQIATQTCLYKQIIDKGGFDSINTTDVDDGSQKIVFARHYNMILANHVMNFMVERPSRYTIKVYLQLGEETNEDKDDDGYYDLETVSSQTFVFLTPGVN